MVRVKLTFSFFVSALLMMEKKEEQVTDIGDDEGAVCGVFSGVGRVGVIGDIGGDLLILLVMLLLLVVSVVIKYGQYLT